MNYGQKPECARVFVEQAKEQYDADPQGVLLEMRRFANQHDTAEFTTDPRVVIQCRLGRCSVSLTQVNGELTIDAPLCARQKPLTK